VRNDVPKSLDEALSRALAVEREERTASIDEFACELAALLPRRHPLRQRWLEPVRPRAISSPAQMPLPQETAPTEMDVRVGLEPVRAAEVRASRPRVTVSVHDEAKPKRVARALAGWAVLILVILASLALLLAAAWSHWQPPSAHACEPVQAVPHVPQFLASAASATSHPFEYFRSQSA
jgi:hypothetical protein